MMKPLTSFADSLRLSPSNRVVWLLSLSDPLLSHANPGDPEADPPISPTPDPAPAWRAASLAITFDGDPYPARIITAPAWRMALASASSSISTSLSSSHSSSSPGGLAATTARIRLADLPGDPTALRAWLAGRDPRAIVATLRLLWTPAPGLFWDAEDAVLMLRGAIELLETGPSHMTLELRDELTARRARRVGRELTAPMIAPDPAAGPDPDPDPDPELVHAFAHAAASPLLGAVLPLVFGRHPGLDLLPLLPGLETRLAAPLGPDDDSAQLVSVAGFPDAGTVQIGDELLGYEELDPETATIGSPTSPLARDLPAGAHAGGAGGVAHAAGELAALVPPEGFQWLVADHACASVTDLRAGVDGSDGAPLHPDDWTAGTRDLGGLDAQIVTLARRPVRERIARAARTVTTRDLLGDDAFAIPIGNEALDPENAIDGEGTTTYATLESGAAFFVAELNAAAGARGARFGRFVAARMFVRYSASARWHEDSQLFARFKRGLESVQVELPRPDSDAAAQSVREREFDVAGALEGLGWDAFAADPVPEVQLQYVAFDATEVRLHDVGLRFELNERLPSEPARRLVARVAGWPREDDDTKPVENPADVLALLIAHDRFAGLGDEAIDADAFDAAREALAADGYAYARRIGAGATVTGGANRSGAADGEGGSTGAGGSGARLGDLLEEAAREAALWVRAGGETIGVARAEVPPEVDEDTPRLDDRVALEREAVLVERIARGESTGDVLELIGARVEGIEGRAVVRVVEGEASEPGAGAIPIRRTLRWLPGWPAGEPAAPPDIPDDLPANAALHDLAARTRAWSTPPPARHEQSYPLAWIVLEPGDAVKLDRPPLGLDDAPWHVESVETKSPARVEIVTRGART